MLRSSKAKGDGKSIIARSGFYATGLGITFQSAVQIGALAVLARLISPEEFGLANAAMLVVALGANIFEGGVALNVAQRGALSREDETAAFWVAIGLAVMILLITFESSAAISGFFSTHELRPVIEVISWGFLLSGLSAVAEARLFSQSQYRLILLVSIVPYTLGYAAVGIILALEGWGYWALIYAHLSVLAIRAVLLLILAPHAIFERPRMSVVCDHLLQTIAFSIVRVATYAANQGDKIVVGRMLGLEALGIYGRAHQVMMLPNKMFVRGVVRVTTPLFASIQNDLPRVRKAIYKSIRLVNHALAPIIAYIVVFREELVILLLGSSWMDVSDILAVLAVAGYFHASYKIPLSIMHSQAQAVSSALSQSIFAGVTVFVAIMVVSHGMLAVAAAVTVVVAVNYMMVSIQVVYRLGASGRKYCNSHGPGLLTGGIFFAVAVLTKPIMIDTIGALSSIIIGALIMVLVIYVPLRRFLL